MGFVQETACFANSYNGKQIWLDYVQSVYAKKAYAKLGINTNGNLSVNADGQGITYYTLPANGVTYGDMGKLFAAPSANTEKGLRANSVLINKGELISARIPAAAKLAGAATVESIYVQNVMKAVNAINERFAATVEAGAAEIDTAGYVSAVSADSTYGIAARNADASYTAANKLTYDATDPTGSITKLKAAFNKQNKASGFRATSMLVSSDVYADLQNKNLLIYKPITLENGDTVEVYNFLGLDITEVPEMTTFKVVMYHRDGVYQASNLNFVLENENDPFVPGGVAIQGEMGHCEGLTLMGADFTSYLIVGLK